MTHTMALDEPPDYVLTFPTNYTEEEARHWDIGEYPRLLDGLLYVGLTILYADAGLGKSMFGQAIRQHLAWGRPFGPWVPDGPVDTLVVDLEGSARIVHERSLAMTPWGQLDSDHDATAALDGRIRIHTEWPGATFTARLATLAFELERAAGLGRPYRLVEIDTLGMFLGEKPADGNAYGWYKERVEQINKLAMHHQCAILAHHHTNKAGEINGSAAALLGGATVGMQLLENPERDGECILKSTKMRVDEPFRYALKMSPAGGWEFTSEITPTQAMLAGIRRAVVDALTKYGPLPGRVLRDKLSGFNWRSVREMARRMGKEGICRYRHGMWQLTQTTIDEHPPCRVCGQPLAIVDGTGAHPTCDPVPAAEPVALEPVGARGWPAGSPGDQANQGEFIDHQRAAQIRADVDRQLNGIERSQPAAAAEPPPLVTDLSPLKRLVESIGTVTSRERSRPIPLIRKADRDRAPWNLEVYTGMHAWTAPAAVLEALDPAGMVVIIDRRGSYPSAMSNVPVAPNLLEHTGPLETVDPKRAGLYLVDPPEWDGTGIGSPFGRSGQPEWVTAPTVRLLDKAGVRPQIRDSWTGKATTNLFAAYNAWMRTATREALAQGEEAHTEFKAKAYRAIRMIHPTSKSSPIWRPDWYGAIVGESNARHWVKGWKSASQCLAMGDTDSAVFLVPVAWEGDPTWVPDGYVEGPSFGQISVKARMTVAEWRMSLHGNR